MLELPAAVIERSPAPAAAPDHPGAFEVRLARRWSEVDAAMALRYRVFFEEACVRGSFAARLHGRDEDQFDTCCDHLLAIDHDRGAVVGTYRLLRRSVALGRHGFYSAREFDLAPLLAQPGELLELGRSCIDSAYRTGAIMALLWRGIARYVFTHDVTLIFGCASLPGSDPAPLADTLAYLHAHHLAPPELRTRAVRGRHVEMRPDRQAPPPARVFMPPLIKGYLRLGGFVGDGAVADHVFNTTDVCVVVKTSMMTQRYYRHYARQARPTGLMTDMSRPLAAALRLSGIAVLAAGLAPLQAGLNRYAPRSADRLARRFHDWTSALLDMEIRVVGHPSLQRPTLYCANHASYLDVVALGAVLETGFVAKSDVASWPVIGSLARLQRTVFVERRRAVAAEQTEMLRARLARGDNLVLFPEGTSSDGRGVLPFRSSLFAAAERPIGGPAPIVQPVWIAYRALGGNPLDSAARPRVASYGEMTLLPQLICLAGQRHLAVELGFAPPVTIAAFASRKELAAHCGHQVAQGLAASLAGPVWWHAAETGALLDSPRTGAIVVK